MKLLCNWAEFQNEQFNVLLQAVSFPLFKLVALFAFRLRLFKRG